MANTKTLLRRGNRRWLNRKGHADTGAVLWSFEVQREKDGERWNWGDFTIRDCSRTVSLNLSIDTQADKTNTINKLNALIEEATKVRDMLAPLPPNNKPWPDD